MPVNGDCGEEHDDDDDDERIDQRPARNTFSPSRTFSTSLSAGGDTSDCTEPLNVHRQRATIVSRHSVDMGTNTAPPIDDTDTGHRMANNWDKFRLLMWKNSLLQWRHKVQTLVEVLVPVLFSVILIFIRSMVDPDYYHEPTRYNPFEINTLHPLRYVSSCSNELKFIFPSCLQAIDKMIKLNTVNIDNERKCAFYQYLWNKPDNNYCVHLFRLMIL